MSNNALNSFRKTFFLVLLFSFVLDKSYAIPTFIDKAVKEKMEVGQTKSFCPTSLVGIDSYHPSSLNFVVQTETGLQNPGITDNIVKVTKGHDNGFINRDYIKIQAVGVGKCRVVCSCSFTIPLQQTIGIANVCYNIEVTEAIVKVTSVSLNKSELLLHKGESEVLSASVSPANATSKLLEWGTSNDKIATVDSQGKVTAIADGSAIITATALDGSNISSACQLQVITPVTSIILSKSSVMLKVDQECKLDAVILPTNATNKKVQWISSNPNVATVDSDGNVKGLSIGSCVVVATSSDGTNVHETCYVTVQNKEFVSQIVLDKDEVALLEGEEKRLAAVVLPSTADNKSLVWRSDNENVATVDEDGLVHAVYEGNTTIFVIAMDGSEVMSKCEIGVLPVSSVKRIAKDRVRVYVANRKVHLENIPSGVLVRIIRPNGSEVFRMRSKMSCVSYQPHTNGLYFVMIDSLLYKLLVP